MRTYTVMWTYLANSGGRTVQAETAFDATEAVVGFFSDDFRAKGTVYVFEGEPKITREPLNPAYLNPRLKL